jgi:membrane protein YdbS with pleckstrin-like domain
LRGIVKRGDAEPKAPGARYTREEKRSAAGGGETAPVRGYLGPGEEIQLESRPHGMALALPLARAVVIALVGGALVVFGPRSSWVFAAAGVVVLAAGATLALAAVWRWDRTKLVLTTEKLFVVYGVARRRAAAVRLARVPAIEVEQSLLGHLLGYGTVIAGDLEIPYVPSPRDVCRLAR